MLRAASAVASRGAAEVRRFLVDGLHLRLKGGVGIGNDVLIGLNRMRGGRPGLEGGIVAVGKTGELRLLGVVEGRGGDRSRELGHCLRVLFERGVIPPQHEVLLVATQQQHADRLILVVQCTESLFEAMHFLTKVAF